MSKIICCLVAICLLAGGALAQTTDLIISEYVDGTFDNQAIEIYNGTNEAVELGDYELNIYLQTGGVFVTMFGGATLAPGDAYVVVDGGADQALLTLADHTVTNLPLDGRNTIVLVRGEDSIVDSIGQRLIDSSAGWSCDEGNTIDHTLRRSPDVCDGDTDLDDVFDPCLEWSFFAVNTYDDLGAHVSSCGTVDAVERNWGSVKADYR